MRTSSGSRAGLLVAGTLSLWTTVDAHQFDYVESGSPVLNQPACVSPQQKAWTFDQSTFEYSPDDVRNACAAFNAPGVQHYAKSLTWETSGNASCRVYRLLSSDADAPVPCPTCNYWEVASRAWSDVCVSAGNFVAVPPSDESQHGRSCPDCGNPVNPATGNKYQAEVDYRGTGSQPLTFERWYNSFSGSSTGLGTGWRHSFSRKLRSDYGLLPTYQSGSPSNSSLYGTPQAACEQGWPQIRALSTGQATTTASYQNGVCNLYEGSIPRGTLPVHNAAYTPPANPPLVALHAERTDGKGYRFAASSGTFAADADVTARLETVAGGYRLTENDTVELYDVNGRLSSITNRAGVQQTLGYDAQGRLSSVTDSFGRSLGFTYDASNRVDTFTDSAGQVYTYSYDANGNLASVLYPGNKTRTYHYENMAFPNALTGITDENNVRFATWTYDGMGRAYVSEHAGGADRTMLSFGDNSTTVTEGSQSPRTYTFTQPFGVKRVSTVSQTCASCGDSASTTYDANGFLDAKTDFNGNVTDYTYSSRGLEESRTEAYGTPLARVVTTQWHPSFRLPTQIDELGRRTVYTYDSNTGDRLTETVTDLATSETRTTTWTYTTFGRVQTVDGPRTDISDITTYAYYTCATGAECGQVHTITNALGHVAEVTSYDDHGNPLTIVDPNGVTTTLTYDVRQRLKTRTAAGATTTFDYDGVGQLDKVILPGGAFLDYTYDDAHRLTDIEDNLGNRIHYTLDSLGNRTKEEVFDPADVLKRKQSQVFNALGRLEQIKNAAGTVVTEYGYDAQGNRTSQLDYSTPTASHATAFLPDALNRIKQVTDAANGVTQYGYNALDQLTSVTDPKNLVTTYTVNALGDVTQQASPDTGTAQYPIHDAAGNRKRQIDARGVQVDYTYDALNRLTSVDYPEGMALVSEDVTYTYDSATQPYGKGRLTGITDESGTTVLIYDARGNVTEERRTIEGTTYVTGYSYDSADRLTGITYPTGRIVTYERNNTLGQVTRVTTTVLGVTTTVADNIAYMPFGGIKGYTLGNGVAVTRSHDLDYRLDELKDQGTALIQDVRLYYDLRGNIDAAQDLVSADRSQTFAYDGLSRLTSADGLYGMRGYTYDATGNRLTETMTPPGGSPVTDTYTYPSNNHRLSSITGGNPTSFTHDEVGNVIGKGLSEFWYNAAGRLNATDSSFTDAYNAAGQRVTKFKGSFVFHYDREGHLLAEIDTAAPLPVQREYVWLGDLPLSLEGVASDPEIIVDNSDPGFSATGNWSSSTSASGFYGADYRVRPAGTISGTQILDNGASGTTKSGTWQTRTNPVGYYGANFERSSQATAQYSWTLPVTTPGKHRVYVRHPSDSSFRSNANYQVTFAGGSQSYTVDQRSGGGAWRLLGTHTFTTTAQVTLTVGAGSTGNYLVADAVKILPIDSEVARWSVPATRSYDVYARWPASIMQSSQAVYRIVHDGGATEVAMSQQTWGDFWMYLGNFYFSDTTTQSVTLLADENWAVAADAVMFLPTDAPPTLKAYYHLDHLGTPQKLTDSSQAVVWDASYEPFGEASLLTESLIQPLRFPGQYFDAETGLHQNHHRDYDPSLGRYLQSDPIGLWGGISTFGYVGQNPLRFADPMGLSPLKCVKAVKETGASYSQCIAEDIVEGAQKQASATMRDASELAQGASAIAQKSGCYLKCVGRKRGGDLVKDLITDAILERGGAALIARIGLPEVTIPLSVGYAVYEKHVDPVVESLETVVDLESCSKECFTCP